MRAYNKPPLEVVVRDLDVSKMGDYYRMIKYKASQRRIDTFDIGNGFTLMNIIMKNEEGKMKSVDTYIGVDRNGFNCVGHTEA